MNDGEISIEGLDKAEVLAALYNASHQQGMGFMHSRGASGMTVQEARDELARREANGCMYFDYFHGRVMKIDLSGDALRTRLYNRDNGDGAAERVIVELRGKKRASAA